MLAGIKPLDKALRLIERVSFYSFIDNNDLIGLRNRLDSIIVAEEI